MIVLETNTSLLHSTEQASLLELENDAFVSKLINVDRVSTNKDINRCDLLEEKDWC